MIEKVEKQIQAYRYFPPDWDGYGGVTFSSATVDSAISLLKRIGEFCKDKDVEITPCPLNDGSIDIELKFEGRSFLFTVHENGRVTRMEK